ncbi:Rieske (2Fe-2S) protein [Parvibium lacunae]|uniref:Rieske (2Fe-2S) protein n=2 Tax=Parvibium lacunae TaxID=1888893 RepID=A0A368L513_9BURK|nr:Rieske 2Fe-2S domain-containing protein [Parvibium lacunae]RCS58686.1 Rieske (2Fe-2S) protein [Parvibium lacunae]
MAQSETPLLDASWVEIAAAEDVLEAGHGWRFPVQSIWGPGTAFIVRYAGKVYGYLNQCAHVPIELDWQPGQFFDAAGLYLICATHGACYEPDTGHCIAGPCRGKQLHKIDVIEQAGKIYWRPNEKFKLLV